MDVHCSRRARMKVAENKQLVRGINLDIVPVMYIFLASYYLSAVTFCYSICDKSVFWWVVYIEQYWNSSAENQLVSMLLLRLNDLASEW